MVYQLAKTSPLITGQNKINLILDENKVVDLQFTPISKYLLYNKSNRNDVLNYSYGENVKMLYQNIKSSFFENVKNPAISEKQLYRYTTFTDDTHEGSYEMALKRAEYKRFNKQFEFFCPIWISNANELNLDKLEFRMCLLNKNGRIVYTKKIDWDEKIKTYINNIYKSLSLEGANTDLLYIDFNKMESHIKGLNVTTGNIQVIDTSYILNNLLSVERPVLEVDNMLIDLFSKHNIICTQIFNFNFVFNLEDLFPEVFLKNMLCEQINAYIDIFYDDKKIELKDFYTNYMHIPKYNINKGEYDNTRNVLDYMHDNEAVSLIDKNKLVQSTFHWVLANNTKSIFNLYNGFAPFYKIVNKEIGSTEVFDSTTIPNNEPDIYTDLFDVAKNPFGIFKYNNCTHIGIQKPIDLAKAITDDARYSYLELDKFNPEILEYTFFEKVLLKTQPVYNILKNASLKTIKVAIFNLSRDWSEINLKNTLNGIIDIMPTYYRDISLDEELKIYKPVLIESKEFLFGYKQTDNVLTIAFLTPTADPFSNDFAKENLYFNAFYENRLSDLIVDKNSADDLDNEYMQTYGDIINTTEFKTYSKYMELLSTIFRNAKLPNDILFNKSFYSKKQQPFNNIVNEVELLKSDKFTEIYRYDTNIIPMFIDIDDNIFKNDVFWCKQYDNTITEHIAKYGNFDGIQTYTKYAGTKLKPVYPSIGYFPLNSKAVDYKHFYLDDTYKYVKEISWYKDNKLYYLPEEIVYEMVNHDSQNNTDNEEIVDALYNALIDYNKDLFADLKISISGEDAIKKFIDKYIKNFYTWSISYDYVSSFDISKQNYKIKFILK